MAKLLLSLLVKNSEIVLYITMSSISSSSIASSSISSSPVDFPSSFTTFLTRYLSNDAYSFGFEWFDKEIRPILSKQLDSYSTLSSGSSVSSLRRYEKFMQDVRSKEFFYLFLYSFQHPDFAVYESKIVRHHIESGHSIMYSRVHFNPSSECPRISSEVLIGAESYPIPSIGSRLRRAFHLPDSCKILSKKEAKRITLKRVGSGSPFMELPVIIIQRIAGELPLSSQTALALVNRSLNNTIGSLSWLKLSADRLSEEYQTFLKLLARDLYANHWLCERCCTLHCKAGGLKMNYFAMLRVCPYAETSVLGRLGTLYWAQVYLVMERHRHGGAHGLPIEALSQNIIRKLKDPRNGQEYSQHVTQQGKISNGELLVRIRLRMDDAPITNASTIRICQHMGGDLRSETASDKEFEMVMKCRLSHYKSWKGHCLFCRPQIRRCTWCAIEYDFSMRMSIRRRLRLDLVVWANLGTGRDPAEAKWRLPQTLLSGRFRSLAPLDFECGLIRKRFDAA